MSQYKYNVGNQNLFIHRLEKKISGYIADRSTTFSSDRAANVLAAPSHPHYWN